MHFSIICYIIYYGVMHFLHSGLVLYLVVIFVPCSCVVITVIGCVTLPGCLQGYTFIRPDTQA